MKNKKEVGGASFSRWTDAAAQAFGTDFHIEINGSREIVAEGCMGVLSCSDEQIKLNMGKQVLMLNGENLIITGMYGKTICIVGRIINVEII